MNNFLRKYQMNMYSKKISNTRLLI